MVAVALLARESATAKEKAVGVVLMVVEYVDLDRKKQDLGLQSPDIISRHRTKLPPPDLTTLIAGVAKHATPPAKPYADGVGSS